MIRFLVIFGNILGIIFPAKLLQKIKFAMNCIRTGYYGTTLKSLGKGTVIYEDVSIRNGRHIEIGQKCVISPQTVLSTTTTNVNTPPRLVIGDAVWIGHGCHITASNAITIGKGSLLGKYITITDNSHGAITDSEADRPPYLRPVTSKGPVIIGDKVWIGDKAIILPGVTIGNSCIIGAGAVVTKDIPARSIAVGNPAEIIRTY